MPLGRELLVMKGSEVIAGLRTATLSWSGESVDITSGENDGFRKLEAASGQEQLDISIEGIMKANVFQDIALGTGNSKMLTDITLQFPIQVSGNSTNATLSGDFRLSSFEEGAPYNDAITFSGTLESSGEWTFSPEAT